MRKGKHLGRVRVRDRPLAWRVESGEEEHKESDTAQVRLGITRNVEAEAGGQQGPGHLGKSEEQQGAATVGVDGEDGRESEEEVDQTESPRRKQSLGNASTGLLEDSRGVEGDDVDTTHLLRQHDDE